MLAPIEVCEEAAETVERKSIPSGAGGTVYPFDPNSDGLDEIWYHKYGALIKCCRRNNEYLTTSRRKRKWQETTATSAVKFTP